jgi:hypothetical protein
MRFQRVLKTLLALLFLSTTASFSNESSQEISKKIKNHLPSLGLTLDDFKVLPGWELPNTIPEIEAFFTHPFDVSEKGSDWLDNIENASSYKGVFESASLILGVSTATVTDRPRPVDPSLNSIIEELTTSIEENIAVRHSGSNLPS